MADVHRSMELNFTITGSPRTKKNSGQMVPAVSKTGKPFVRIVPSEAYRAWHKQAKPQLDLFKIQMRAAAFDTPVNVAATFYRDASIGDAVGYYQGLADALQEAQILTNDKWIVQWDGSRLAVDRKNPRIEVTITPLAGEQMRMNL